MTRLIGLSRLVEIRLTHRVAEWIKIITSKSSSHTTGWIKPPGDSNETRISVSDRSLCVEICDCVITWKSSCPHTGLPVCEWEHLNGKPLNIRLHCVENPFLGITKTIHIGNPCLGSVVPQHGKSLSGNEESLHMENPMQSGNEEIHHMGNPWAWENPFTWVITVWAWKYPHHGNSLYENEEIPHGQS